MEARKQEEFLLFLLLLIASLGDGNGGGQMSRRMVQTIKWYTSVSHSPVNSASWRLNLSYSCEGWMDTSHLRQWQQPWRCGGELMSCIIIAVFIKSASPIRSYGDLIIKVSLIRLMMMSPMCAKTIFCDKRNLPVWVGLRWKMIFPRAQRTFFHIQFVFSSSFPVFLYTWAFPWMRKLHRFSAVTIRSFYKKMRNLGASRLGTNGSKI